jgi:hypothetical protein
VVLREAYDLRRDENPRNRNPANPKAFEMSDWMQKATRRLWPYTCLFLLAPSPTLLSPMGTRIGNDVIYIGVTGTCDVVFGVGVNLG